MHELLTSDINKLVRSVRRRKWYYITSIVLASIVVFCTVYALILPAITLTQTQSDSTQNNPTLSYVMYSKPGNTHRAYLEYAIPGTQRSNTFGVLRQSVIYVYAYAGETICLGSDVTSSLLNVNDGVERNPTGVDILMIGPDGTKYTFDNDAESGLGFINTYAQEVAGANYEGSDNTDGYTPHEFKVRQTGLYEVRFHSYNGNAYGCNAAGLPHLRRATNTDYAGEIAGSSAEPVYIEYNKSTWSNTGNSIGAFDITVVNDGEVKTGRTYADYLAFNIGKNSSSSPTFYGDFYIVTSDGYIYRSQYELDPFGFIFFANSRGVVDTDTGYSAYHSIRANGQESGTAQMIMDGVPYTVYTPQHEATDFDKTYMIFFEEPDPALQGILYQRAFAPGMATNLEFIGSKEGNITYVGNGGYFKFDVENAVSATISISFEAYNEANGTTYENVEINANVTPGTNYIYWDGNDKNGEVVPVGWYRNGTIDIEVTTHAGEIHFPFLDVENGDNVMFERINRIYRYENGILTDVTDEYDESKYNVYYNNTILPDNRNSQQGEVIANGEDHSGGIDSSGNRTMYFRKSTGDYTIIDVWSYSVSKADMEINTDLIVEDLDGYYTVNLTGFVFFDKDYSHYYELTGGDFSLSDVEVSLDYYYCGTRWSVATATDAEAGDATATDAELPAVISELSPIPHTSLGEDENGNPKEIIDYYYHNYVVRRHDDGKYYLYKYDYTDYLHENDPEPALDQNGEPIIVEINTEIVPVQLEDGTVETVTKYLVWIPVHRETTTDTIGNYYFSGILVNEDMYAPPPEHPEYGNVVVSVKNPNPELYELTTAGVCTGDFANVNGTDLDHGSQVVKLSVLEQKIAEKVAADPDQSNFFFHMSDVGYYYETYEPPLTVVKHWGSTDTADNIERIVFTLQAYSEKDGVVTVHDERELTLSYFRWFDILTDLPAAVIVDGNRIPLSYRVSAERFVKFENETYSKYTLLYHWDADPPYCEYTVQLTDANGVPTENSEEEPIVKSQFPFESYISPLEHLYTGDRITIENWHNDTTYITLTKYGAYDNVTKLPLATFKLQKLVTNEQTGVSTYVDVITDLGVYTVTTDINGVAIFRGLTEGTYRIVETVPPEYYNLLDDPIVFTVAKEPDPDLDNGEVYGSYEESYFVDIHDHLIEQPFSLMRKVDQYGENISDAEFTFYKADENYNYDPENDVVIIDYDEENNPVKAVVKIGADGTSTLRKKLPDGSYRSMYISELLAALDGSNRFVLAETHVPDGYRAVGEAHMRITGEGLSSYIICDNPYESGVWVEPMVTVYAPETLQVANMDDIGNISSASYVDPNTGVITYIDYTESGKITHKGTLFGVMVKRNTAEPNVGNMRNLTFNGWVPVYGNAIDGYHTVADYEGDDILGTVINAVTNHRDKNIAYEFTENNDKELMYVHIEDFPDRADRYLTYMMQHNMPSVLRSDFDPPYYSDPQFAILYFYSTAPTLSGVTADNTVRVTSHGLYNRAKQFTTHFATNILIPDINNALYVQKSDVGNSLINNAVFGLYPAVSSRDNKGYYVGEDEDGGKVYITLDEGIGNDAMIYTGYIDDDGYLVTTDQRLGMFEFDTTGFADILDLTPEEILDAEARLDHMSFVGSGAGNIIVKEFGGARYIIEPAVNAEDERLIGITHDRCHTVLEQGTAHFRYLYGGKYYLRELFAPPGFSLNPTNVEVFVGKDEVYANAGDLDDYVMVGNGVGYIVSTLNQFASYGDIRETLTYIVAALQLDKDEGSELGFADLTDHLNWPYVSLDPDDTTKNIFTGLEDTGDIFAATVLYLMYNGAANENRDEEAHTIFDYMVHYGEGGANNPDNLIEDIRFWTKSGWSDLAIFQHKTAADNSDANNPEVIYTDISVKDGKPYNISHLFSGSTFVRVADKTNIDLKLRKINSATSARLKDAGFLLYTEEEVGKIYYTLEGDNIVWRSLSPNENESDLGLLYTDSSGEIDFGKLDDGVYYLKEVEAPRGFFRETHIIEVEISHGNVTVVKDNGVPLDVLKPELSDDGVWTYTFVVPNDMGYLIPATGGAGTTLYTVGGIGIMLIAAVVYGYICMCKRKKRKG